MESLILIHAGLGELGIVAFIWAFVELLNPTEARVKRAKIASWIGFAAFVAAWLGGGFYYVYFYGDNIKPFIKDGPSPEAHGVFMETKEHIFLFLPLLAAVAVAAIHKLDKYKPVLMLIGLIVLIGLSMAGMGYLVSSGYRDALEVIAQ